VNPERSPRHGPALGVDIGGTKVLGVALDADDEVAAEARATTPHSGIFDPNDPAAGDGAAAVAGAVAEVVAALRRATDDDGRAPVGVGVPGMCDRQGVLRFAPNLAAASGADIAALLAERLPDTILVIENDATCAAVAEHRLGAAAGDENVLLVTLGTGIGGGVISEGRVLLGASGFAGEIGHMVVDPAGPPCPCGRRGCWERYASGGGLARLAREAAYAGRLPAVVEAAGGDAEAVRGEDVTKAALAGDPGALGVMEDLGWWVALGLTNLTAVLDPARIVIGGGLVEVGELLLTPTKKAYAEQVEGGRRRPDVAIVPAALGERAGAVGAALTARDRR